MPYELYHHGVLGQRWGVRRYQRSDGSLTRAGRKRFKEVSNDKREQKHVEKDAIKILTKQSKRAERKADKFSKRTDEKSVEKAKRFIERRKDINLKINKIKSKELVAGKDYVTTNNSLLKIPYAYVGLSRPKIGIASIPNKKVVFK